jgi:hypothetical protein
MCEPAVVREKPRYPPTDFVSFPARPAMDVRNPRSLAPVMIDEDRGYDSLLEGVRRAQQQSLDAMFGDT